MVRRLDNCESYFERDGISLLSGKYRCYLQIGKKKLYSDRRATRDDIKSMAERSKSMPVKYLTVGDRNYWRYDSRWFTDSDGHDGDEVRSLVIAYDLRNEKKLSEAKTVAAAKRLPDGSLRESIPGAVRHSVWERDGGACRSCGNKSELQYDHLIPVSMGGANTVDNLQILCGPCNRRKGASVV
jgi:5-methylcytosine-specific restriction endonuclease McrA